MLAILSCAAVPASFLLLLATLPARSISTVPSKDTTLHSKYIIQKYARPQAQWPTGEPVAVRKMSADESEMFFPQYWQFQEGTEERGRDTWSKNDIDDECDKSFTNTSTLQALQAPFSLHIEQQLSNHPLFGRIPRAFFPFQKRGFNCPTDTSDCSSIARPNSCCPTGDTCQLITDTGQGDVGCCPNGQSCSGQVSQCQQGYPSCPGSSGGGCCIPGYTCAGIGCTCSLDRGSNLETVS